MNISSRTPEGEDNRCPVCRNALRLEPSRPPGDAPCPFCGTFLSFPAAQPQDRSRAPRSKGTRQIEVKDRVRVLAGTFAAIEGRVDRIDEWPGLVRITLTIFGRPVPVALEQWQVELVGANAAGPEE
jgi:transcription antitermination factor NusG